MYQDKDAAAELRRLLEEIGAKDQLNSDPLPPSKLELRVLELTKNGYTIEAARAIANLELDPEFRRNIINDVASNMFGGGLKESRSAIIVWPK